MVAGTSAKRTWKGPWPVPDQSNWGPNDTTQDALAEKGLGFNCLNYPSGKNEGFMSYPYLREKSFIDEHCVDGVRAELMFPSCWDGKNLDSEDHKSHVAYPNLIQDGACPTSHPVFLPILFYETIWNTQAFKGIPGQFVFANGDPTGFGYHGDFIAAWKDGVLDNIRDDPTCTDHNLQHRTTDGLQEHCLAIANTIQTEDEAAQCLLNVPEALELEQVHGLIGSLPGGINITGVRHDPGSPEDHVVVSSMTALSSTALPVPSSPPASVMVPSTTVVVSSASDTTSTVAITPAPVMPETSVHIHTSSFVTNGTSMVVVFIEEIVTTTVTATTEAPLVVRHGHKHGGIKHA